MSDATPANTNKDQYILSRVIPAHKSDVKTMATTASGVIISAGRDETINFWTKKAGEYSCTLKYQQPKGIYVNSLAYCELKEGWRLFAGRKDGSIAMYGSGNSEPIQVFREHENNVCCLHVNEKNGVLLSGSWDSNVIAWPINDLSKSEFAALKLTGHTLSVWALASFPDRPEYYLTASADKTIRMWNRDETVHVFNGHSDVVRALAVMSNEYFLSAGNDGNICYWDVQAGACIGKFSTNAHDFIYSLTLSDSHILTTGEDGTLEFWQMDGTCGKELRIHSETVLQIPSSSTWDSKVLTSTDIIVGGSDGNIYVLTKDQNRIAPMEIREAFDAEVVAKMTSQMKRKQESNTIVIKVALDDGPPQLELKYEKGSDPTLAAEKFITDNQLPISYLNEVVDYICQNIPEAAAARTRLTKKKQPGERKEVNGRMYDYVLDVTLENGNVLKLPFNESDDADYAAQLFVEKHNLPVKFLGMLSQLIRNEKLGINTQSSGSSDYYDPFTGPGRYVPGGSSNMGGGGGGGYVDPLTGGGRYVPGGEAMDTSSFSGDPLTGDGGYRSAAASGAPHGGNVPLSSLPKDKKKPRGPLVPVPEYYTFGVAGASQKALTTLKDVNEKQDAFQLSAEQISSLEELLHVSPTSKFSSSAVQSAFETALQWQINDLVPVLDFFRIGLLHHSLNAYFCEKDRGLELINRFIAILVSDPTDLAIRVFVCRCIANSFSHPEGRALFAATELSILAPLVVKQAVQEKSVLQIAASTALANWSLALLQQSQECAQLGPKEDLLRAIITTIENIGSFGGMAEDAIIRLLQTIATLMWGDSNVIKLAKNRNMASLAAKFKDAVVAENGKNIARDIVEMTYAV